MQKKKSTGELQPQQRATGLAPPQAQTPPSTLSTAPGPVGPIPTPAGRALCLGDPRLCSLDLLPPTLLQARTLLFSLWSGEPGPPRPLYTLLLLADFLAIHCPLPIL